MQIEYLAHKAYERILNPFEHSNLIYPFTQNGKNYEKVRADTRESISHIIEIKRQELEDLRINNPGEYYRSNSMYTEIK